MKTFLCVLLFSSLCFSQGKPINTQRYQIVELKPQGDVAMVFLIDGETGRTWQLVHDTVSVLSNKGEFTEASHWWMQVPVERVKAFGSSIRDLLPAPEEKKNK